MSWLVRLYPPSWRKRYGGELELLVQEVPGGMGTALDLLVGAAIAYRDAVRANRMLSTAGAFLHGLCVAVLVQAIVFVSLVMVAQGSAATTTFTFGPITVATFVPGVNDGRLRESFGAVVWINHVAATWVPGAILLLAAALALTLVMAAPRLLRGLR